LESRINLEQLEVKYLGLSGVSFSIGGEHTVLTPDKLAGIIDYLSYYEQWYLHWTEYIKRYENFDDKISMILEMQEKKYKAYYEGVENAPVFSYNAGDDFTHLKGIPIPGFNYDSPEDALDSIRTMFEEKDQSGFVYNYEITDNMCNILTPNKEHAEYMFKFIYSNIVSKVIEFIKKSEES
jgi:hypothetical protein